MSKKKPQKRRPKEVSKPRDADGLRELASELTELANRLETYADGMEAMGIAKIRPLTGNFHLAVERIRIFTAQQVLARLQTEATRQGRDAHDVLGR